MSISETAAAHHADVAPNCVICGTALAGPLSVVFRVLGITRSSRNPNLCSRCNTHAEEGRLAELTVLFADLSSFTELTHDLGPERTHEVVDAFLQMATYALVKHDAFIDKYIGDAVMAFFNAPIRRADHPAQAVAAANEIMAGISPLRKRFGLELDAVVAIASGYARVGRLGSADGKDYTAVGEVVNLAARLEGVARQGEIVVDQAVFERVAPEYPEAAAEEVTLKGFKEPVPAYHLTPKDAPVQASRHQAAPDETPRQRLMRLGGIVFSILGAPCAAGALLGPLAVALGIGALFGAATSSAFTFLDQGPIRIPMLVLATLGALANLYTLWHARQLKGQAESEGLLYVETRLDRSRRRIVLSTAIATLLVVAYELYAHEFIMGHSWP